MRFSTAVVSFLPVLTAVAAPLEKRADNFNQVYSEITTLRSDLADLTTKTNAFQGDILGSLGIIVSETKLDGDLKSTAFTVKKSDPFTDAESTNLTLSLANLIQPITDSLSAIDKKYITFRNVLQAPIVLLDLYQLRGDTNTLISNLVEKVTPQNAQLIQLGSAAIVGAFNQSITTYGGKP